MAFTFQREEFDPATMALAKFFADLGARQHEDKALQDRLAAQKEALRYEQELKTGDRDQVGSAIADAIRLMYEQNRPDMPVDSEIQTRALGDLSGMKGVKGTMDPREAVERALTPAPEAVPTQDGPMPMTGDIGETRKMTSEEILPELMARLAKAGASTEDMDRLNKMLVGRSDYNTARTSGAPASPYQSMVADDADADIGYKNAQSLNLLAAAANKSEDGYEYTEDEIRSIAEGVARGDYKNLSEALSGRDPKLRPMVVNYMSQNGLRPIDPKLREKFADIKSAEASFQNLRELWDAVESAPNLIEKNKAWQNFRGTMEGSLATFRGITGDVGVLTNQDAQRIEKLLAPGAISQLTDAFTGDGKSPLPEVKQRLNAAEEFFKKKLAGYMGGYYFRWKELEDAGYADPAFPGSSPQPSGLVPAAPVSKPKDPLGIF